MPPPGQRCIVVDDLRLAVFIGVHEREKVARQEVSIAPHVRGR
jgi:dihydroneopterin aldolase